MAYFRSKPVVIEAFQMTREARQSNGTWPQWLIKAMGEGRCGVGAVYPTIPHGEELSLGTPSGQEVIYWGDWIVLDRTGELHLCGPGAFAIKYEPV